MVQFAVLVAGVAAGLFSRRWKQAWIITVVTFVVTSAVQTPLVVAGDDIESPLVYWSIQALTLLVGLGLARALFAVRAARRRASAPA
jgi:uncharacterized membrane protein YjjP (DUF1212 family)